MKLTIEIEMNNDAFKDNPMEEVKWILENLLKTQGEIEYGFSQPLRDSYGNKVGTAKLEEEE